MVLVCAEGSPILAHVVLFSLGCGHSPHWVESNPKDVPGFQTVGEYTSLLHRVFQRVRTWGFWQDSIS
ncbi:MAG: hypothetical protein BWX80_02716 [Candidatus Hydrogenedentes bacterium ADurb.Bin101]|nr:MAG: hypothetical protein BWX80_02716 [Candidatus Hydrogenedentes bacterium ADurb.Bin101]